MRYQWLAIMLLLAQPPNLLAQNLEVAISHLPPLSIIEAGHPPRGQLVDILRHTLDRAQLQYHFAHYPRKRLFSNIADGNSDITLGVKSNQILLNKVLFSEQPTIVIELCLYSLDHQPKLTKQQLLGKKIGLLRGYDYGHRFNFLLHQDNQPNITIINSQLSALAMLEKGRIDFLMDYKLSLEPVLQQHPVENIVGHILEKFDMYFVVSKQLKGAQVILNLLESHYDGNIVE